MKKIKFLILSLFVLFVVQVQAQTISLVVNTWPPYVDTALADDGLAMKIVKTAFKRVGYTPEVRIQKWEKALEGSKLGVYDVVGAIWKTRERKGKLLYSNAYLTNNIVLVAHVNSQMKFDSLTDLQGILVGVLKGYEYDEKFMKDPKILKFQANRLTQNLISVQNGKLDVAVADKRLAMYELKHFMGSNSSEFQFLPKPLSSRKLYIAAPIENAGSKVLIAKFNQGLAAIKKDGTYQKILDEYTF
jgi:polar amino acid transport system substrate-binding protein